MATITQTSTVITINGAYKDFTGGSGSTTTVIQYSSGDAPVAGDAGRFLMWKVTAGQTGTWQIRYIESATSTTVTVGDGGFSSAPPNGATFAISTNLDDIVSAVAGATNSGTSYTFNGREWDLENGAFLADVNKSLEMTANSTTNFQPHYLVATGCAVQFGRLLGGEANNSFETTEGCRLGMEATGTSISLLGGYASYSANGPIFNLYGCQVETYGNDMFLRGGGPVRFIGCIFDGVMGGRWLSSDTEIVQTRFSGNLNGGVAWSLGATFTRPISDTVFYDNNTVCKGYQIFSGEFRNSTFTDTNTQIIDSSGASSTLVFDFIDCTTFSNTKISDPKGTFNQAKSINYTLTDISGTGLDDVKVAVYDNAQTIQTGLQTSVSGVINQINAVFFCRPHNSATENKAPFDIRIRKYGYVYQGFQSAVSSPILQEVRLPVNNELVSTEAQAAAITGISINFVTETITITQDHNAQSLYDYYQYQLYQDANLAYGEDLIKTGNAFDLDDYDLVVDNAVYTGDITTTGRITFQNGAQGIGVFTSSSGTQTSISLTFNNLSTSTVEIFDNTGASVQRYTNQTGTLVYITPLGSTGGWSYIIDRIGYRPIISSFDPTLNNLIIDGSQDLLLTAQGNTMYSGSSSALVNITYDFVTPQLNIEIGNGGVSPQVIFDEVEQSLITADGMRWQKENNTLVTFDDLPAVGQMLFMQDNIRLKRASAGDVNAAVNGYVLSTQGTPVDGVNGNVNYIASPDYATPIWDALLANHNVSSSFGALLQLLETKTQADSRQAILVGEHNDTQADIAALNDFNPVTDTVANVTLVATTTTNTDMRGTDGANTIAPDNAGITQIQTDISNLNDITATDVYTEFTSGTNEDAFKADVSGLATQSSVDTIDSVVDSIAVQTTRVDGLIENSSGDRFTAKALETAPTDEASESEIHSALDSYTNKGDYKADVSALATEANATTNTNSIITEANANEAKIDTIDANVDAILVDTSTTIPAQVSALNDISPAEVNAEVGTALSDYDAPTKAELDATEAAILAAINALNDLDQQEVAEAVWDYLQSDTTVSASMKEAVQKILVNANLIPATV